MDFKWNLPDRTEPHYFKQLIKARGFDEKFLEDNFADLPDFKLMKDISKAADRIVDAVKKDENIIIYGHDDLDGLTSTYILVKFLQRISHHALEYYIPNRLLENHGLQQGFIDKVDEFDADLVITVDGGISSVEAIDKIKADVIITDHHLIPETLPNAYAIVNPKFNDCPYPYEMLAGVGVTYALISVLSEKLNIKLSKAALIWTVIGSIADKVPLDGVNRKLARKALTNNYIIRNEDENLYILRKHFEKESNYSDYSFLLYIMGLFSNGRKPLGRHSATDFLFADFKDKKKFIEPILQKKEKSDIEYKKLIEYLNRIKPDHVDTHLIHMDKENKIPYPLLGKAASFFSSIFKVPVLLLKHDKEKVEVVCEARGVEGFNFVDAFTFCSSAIRQYGGHERAAGFYTSYDQLPVFKKKFADYVKIHENVIRENKKIDIDIIIDLNDLNSKCIQDLRKLQPFGKGNPKPIFLIENTYLGPIVNKLSINSVPKEIDMNKRYDIVLKWLNNMNYRILDFRLVK